MHFEMRGKLYMVIGTFAYCGSGQDTLADGFCRYKGYIKYSLGDVVRNIARKRNLPQSREILRSIRKECDEKYGKTFIPNTVLEQIRKDGAKYVIITGMRTIEEYKIFKEKLGMILVFVYANKATRFQRMLKRAEEKDYESLETLENQMEIENDLFDYELLKEKADYFFPFELKLNDYLQFEKTIITNLFEKLRKL